MSFGTWAGNTGQITPKPLQQTWTVPFLNEQAARNAEASAKASPKTLSTQVEIRPNDGLWILTWTEEA